MSPFGKLAVVGVLGVAGYYYFYKQESPVHVPNVVQEANKDYNKHRAKEESKYMERNATILQDDPSMRVITQDQTNPPQ